jgi:hypothetical protein
VELGHCKTGGVTESECFRSDTFNNSALAVCYRNFFKRYLREIHKMKASLEDREFLLAVLSPNQWRVSLNITDFPET